MATNTLESSRYKLRNYHKGPRVISVALIHTQDVLVTKLVFNSKRTRNTNFADELELHSIVSPMRNSIAQFNLFSGFPVCQFEALDEKG